jgi:hypothetical protein
MKKIFVSLSFALLAVKSFADEGMWLPMLLGQQVYNDMVKRGLKLKPEQLYSINQSSIKDAIMIFGGGCTGELVSNQGLIFTNHHCGYDAIAKASSVENNYLKDGFWAADKGKEIKTELTVQFLDKIEDVTERINKALGDLQGKERMDKYSQIINDISKETVGNNEFRRAAVASMFKGNQFFLFVYNIYKDVRFVGTPPEAIGKYGGDTDNWEWPRHTGDFSVFRVYADKNGNPAKYNSENTPMKPKHFLPVSIKPLKDGDYSMIFGYPGSTNRYEISDGVKLSIDINNPTLVKLRDMRLKFMLQEMMKDPAVKLQLASSYAGIANYWKFFDGETKQLVKHNVFEEKKKYENEFSSWAKGKSEYENITTEYTKNYDNWTPYAKHAVYIREGINGSPLLRFASNLISMENLLNKKDAKQEDIDKAIKNISAARAAFLEEENKKSDQQILANVLAMFMSDVDANQHPKGFYNELFKASTIDENPFKKWASTVFENTMIFDEAKWKAFTNKPSVEALNNDPAFKTAAAFIKNYNTNYFPKFSAFSLKNNDLGRAYLKGIMEMNPEKKNKMYPDANSTMRVSFGNVKSYSPKDAVKYDIVCTMKGAMAKYVKDDYEFDLPKRYIDLYNAKDFGRYEDPTYKDVVISFITTNDITGGNSGSPVLNAKGELIGLAFDGNYEALSHKLTFDKDLNRTICVDARYVLWCIEKLGNAKHIVDELDVRVK